MSAEQQQPLPPYSRALSCLLNPAPPQIRVKHQKLNKVVKKEVLERSHTDLALARCTEEEARFELARRLTDVRAEREGSGAASLRAPAAPSPLSQLTPRASPSRPNHP
jgi:hypothetical protein